MLKSMDPDSMRGKFLLIVADKLVIGAILAFAFYAYDYWKTKEIRTYNRIIQETQDDFKRAEFTKELLPIVLDKNQEVSTRIEVLGSLIRTKSIDENSAFVIAVSFLREGKLVRPDRNYVDDQLVVSFVRMLSPIIPDVLPQILDAYGDYPNKGDAPAGYVSVLRQTFAYALKHFSADKLKILDDITFVAENLGVLVDISRRRDSHHESWNTAGLLALEILQDIQILQSINKFDGKEEQEVLRGARFRLQKLINPETNHSESMNLSSSILREVRRLAINDDTFVESAFSVIQQSDKVAESFERMRPGREDPFLHQFSAAKSYITFASSVNPTSEVFAIPIVRKFLDILRAKSISNGNA